MAGDERPNGAGDERPDEPTDLPGDDPAGEPADGRLAAADRDPRATACATGPRPHREHLWRALFVTVVVLAVIVSVAGVVTAAPPT